MKLKNISEVAYDDVFADLEKYGSCSILAVFVLIGLAGNLLCLRFLAGRSFRNKSYAVYFIGLATADIVTLLGTGLPILLEWIFHKSWRLGKARDICITFRCILECSENLSSMLMLAVATDRYIAVVYPLRRRVMCTVKRAIWTTGALIGVSILLALPDFVLLGLGLESLDCLISKESLLDFIEKNRFILFSLVLPMLVTLFLNCKVLCAIRRARSNREKYLDQSGSSIGLSRRQLRLTLALVTVTFISAVLLLPVVALEIWEFFDLNEAKDNQTRKDILTNTSCISRLIEVFNISINFFALICVTSDQCCCFQVLCRCHRCQYIPCCDQPKGQQIHAAPSRMSTITLHYTESRLKARIQSR